MDVRIQTRYSETVTPRLAKAGGTGSGIFPELTPADGPRRAELHSSHDARRGSEMQAPAKARGNAAPCPIGKGSVRSAWSEGMSNRKPISKTTRFEVLKRDKFTCQYCGAKAPNVRLHVDHVHPVSDLGSNLITNLITACQDCNLGKSDQLLDVRMPSQKAIRDLRFAAEEYFYPHKLDIEGQLTACFLYGHSYEKIAEDMKSFDFPGYDELSFYRSYLDTAVLATLKELLETGGLS